MMNIFKFPSVDLNAKEESLCNVMLGQELFEPIHSFFAVTNELFVLPLDNLVVMDAQNNCL
jgi:hypothetical protein